MLLSVFTITQRHGVSNMRRILLLHHPPPCFLFAETEKQIEMCQIFCIQLERRLKIQIERIPVTFPRGILLGCGSQCGQNRMLTIRQPGVPSTKRSTKEQSLQGCTADLTSDNLSSFAKSVNRKASVITDEVGICVTRKLCLNRNRHNV